jgi:methionyl-tRNA formyltransferase
MGLPAVQLVAADNQAGIAAALAAGGITISLGDFREVKPEQIAAAVVALSADGARRREMGARGWALIDGHGARRLTAALGRKLQVTVVSDAGSWLNASIPQLVAAWESAGHVVSWIHDPAELGSGDLAFFLSLSRILSAEALTRHAHNLVVHESALPSGRGWSPLTWQVLEGKNEIPVTLFEAAAGVDSGDIYAQTEIRLKGDELVDELRAAQASATFDLCRKFVADYPYGLANARAQSGEPTCYPRRRPADSRLDPDKTLRELFNQLRVADPVRYPAFFEMAGRRFEIRLSADDTTAVARNP